jgi:hypothetical protein
LAVRDVTAVFGDVDVDVAAARRIADVMTIMNHE